MRISLVMPNYNHASYLRASIGGMLAQQRPPDEIIIIDDASNDTSLAEIERLTSGAIHVRIVKNKARGGVVKALNDGLALATGDLVAFLGADDRVSPGFLSTLAPMMERFPDAAFGCARVEIHDHLDSRTGERPIVRPLAQAGYVSPAQMRHHLRFADNFFLGQVTLYRSARLRELGGFHEDLGSLSDGLLLRRMAVRWGYVFTPEILGMWRVHGANYSVTSAVDPDVIDRMISVGRHEIDGEREYFPPDYADLFERRMRFNCARLLISRVSDARVAETIYRIIRGSRVDSSALALIGRLGPLAPFFALGWLTVRLRPFALSWLIAEAGLRGADFVKRTAAPGR